MCLLATDQLFFCLMCSEIAIKQLIFELFGMDPVTAVRVRGLSPSHFLFAHLVRQAEGHRILESRSRQAPCSEKHVLLCKCSKTQGFPRNINTLLHKSIDVCSKGRLPTVSRPSPDSFVDCSEEQNLPCNICKKCLICLGTIDMLLKKCCCRCSKERLPAVSRQSPDSKLVVY